MKASMTALIGLVVLAVAGCGGGDSTETAAAPPDGTGEEPADCQPLETRPANASQQQPTFPDQTRACEVTSNVAYDVTVLATGLVHPWAVEPLPDGSFLVTERPGRMRLVAADGTMGEPISGLPEVHARGQAGLLDVAPGPDFATDRTIFWSYSEPRDGGNGTSVARGVLSADGSSLEQVQVIFRALPTYDNNLHYGSRLVFDGDGHLFITTGERSDEPMRMHSQQLDNHLGKVLRIRLDGTVPDDNPFVGEAGAQPEVWSYGHRNTQAAAMAPDGSLWIVEHGPRGGDEVNRVEPGVNHGWPLVTFGQEYSGDPIPDAVTHREGFEPPIYYWDPVIGPSGAQWYTGDAFSDWQGDLFIGGLVATALVRLEIEDGRVTGEEHLLAERGQRVRDVRQGPDGALYVVTDEEDGELWRIAPRQ